VSRKLVVSDGTRERELQLVGRIVVGRDPTCDITHDHSLLSRRHAEFVSAGELVVVRDLGSRNGVFVNGTKTAEHSLSPGDIVQIGPLRAQYIVDAVPLSIAPDDHDTERTTVKRAAVPTVAVTSSGSKPPAADPPSGPPAAAPAGEEDDETRLISRRSIEPEADKPGMPAVSARSSELLDDDGDDATRFITTQQRNVVLGDEPQPPAAAVVHAPAQSLRTFVFFQVVVLGSLVIAAAAISFRVDGVTAPLTAFVVPLIVALAGGYLVAGIIDRRFVRASAEREQ
jgi:pSer/pThr/pTyr-binding forkhead associated (FHA) protein